MGKYEPLARYLRSRDDDSWSATFADIERALGFELPRSAREHRAWWANQKDGNHSQAAGWQTAGWETRDVDLRRGLVRFERRSHSPLAGRPAADTRRGDLWEKAEAVTGIADRDELIERALLALIQREAAQALIRLGGSDPTAKAAPRERPWA